MENELQTLTHSRLRKRRACARDETWTFDQGYRPIEDEHEARDFGTLWHQAHDVHAKGKKLSSLFEHDIDPISDDEAIRRRQYMRAKVSALWVCYNEYWSEKTFGAKGKDSTRAQPGDDPVVMVPFPNVELYKLIAAEQVFTAPLVNPHTMRKSTIWQLRGAADGVLQDSRERHVVLERKSTSLDITDGSDYFTKLSLDYQLSIYTIGVESLGYETHGCVYDVTKRPGQRPLKATPEEKRKVKKDGTPYANIRYADETPLEFYERIVEAIREDPEKYFQRRFVSRNEGQLFAFLENTWEDAKAKREDQLADRGERRPNPDACFMYGQCHFWSCCSTATHPRDYPDKYQKLDDPFVELREEGA